MSVVTERKSLGFPTRLGVGDCAVLNVNAGSFHNPARVVVPGGSSQDMCMFGGELHAIHVEGDNTVGITAQGQVRGPYVQKYSGGAWSLVGTTLCPDADSIPVDGGRTNPGQCRIATDPTGTYLFAAFIDDLVLDAASESYTPWIRIYEYSGGSWTQVASEGLFNVHLAGGGTGSGGTPSLAVSGAGLAYVAYQLDDYTPTRIIRSDGSTMFVPDTFPASRFRGDQNKSPTLAVQSDGRVVGAYAQANVIAYQGSVFAVDEAQQHLVLFDADSGAELRRTTVTVASPDSEFMPYIVLPRAPNTIGFSTLLLNSTALGGYDGDKILFGEQSTGGILVPENGTGDFTTLSGGYPFGGDSRFCFDPTDAAKRLAWFTGRPPAFDDVGIDVWQPACSNTFTPANPINHAPAHAAFVLQGLPAEASFVVDCLFGNSNFWGLRGPCVPVCDGTNLYVIWLYFPFGDSTHDDQISNDLQWIVHSYPITTTVCDTPNAPLFGSRHKAHA